MLKIMTDWIFQEMHQSKRWALNFNLGGWVVKNDKDFTFFWKRFWNKSSSTHFRKFFLNADRHNHILSQ